jgi:hypothetical protein
MVAKLAHHGAAPDKNSCWPGGTPNVGFVLEIYCNSNSWRPPGRLIGGTRGYLPTQGTVYVYVSLSPLEELQHKTGWDASGDGEVSSMEAQAVVGFAWKPRSFPPAHAFSTEGSNFHMTEYSLLRWGWCGRFLSIASLKTNTFVLNIDLQNTS